jgi:hypothetical protein
VQDGKANRRKIMQRSATHCTFDTLVLALQEQTREPAHLKRHSFATIDDAKRRRINPVNTCNSNTNDDEFLSFDDALQIVQSVSAEGQPLSTQTTSRKYLVCMGNVRNKKKNSEERPVKPEDRFIMKFAMKE